MSLSLAPLAAVAGAIAQARSVSLSAYTLRDGSVRQALVHAAEHGAAVRVRLERDPFDDGSGDLHRANAETIAVLRAAGVDADLTQPGEPVLHMKAAVTDATAWLDDRNWSGDGRETIVRTTDHADVDVVVRALRGEPARDGHLTTTKAQSQRLEAQVIAQAGAAPVAVESESFGTGTIYNAILARAKAHQPTRLIVAGREAHAAGKRGDRERHLLARLASFGVEVRVGAADGELNEKLAIAGNDAWVGSTNATFAFGVAGQQRDWGLATRERSIVQPLSDTFEHNWRTAQPLDAILNASCATPSATTSTIPRPVPSSAPRSTSASISA